MRSDPFFLALSEHNALRKHPVFQEENRFRIVAKRIGKHTKNKVSKLWDCFKLANPPQKWSSGHVSQHCIWFRIVSRNQ